MTSKQRSTDHPGISVLAAIVHLVVLGAVLEVVVVCGGRVVLHIAAIDVTTFAVVVSATVDGLVRGTGARVSVIHILHCRDRNCGLASTCLIPTPPAPLPHRSTMLAHHLLRLLVNGVPTSARDPIGVSLTSRLAVLPAISVPCAPVAVVTPAVVSAFAISVA